MHLSVLATWGSTNKRIVVQEVPGIKRDPVNLKNKQDKNSWRCNLSERVFTLPRKQEDLSPILSTANNRKEGRKEGREEGREGRRKEGKKEGRKEIDTHT
jgi:flagellar biosynthesis/type III secretory pathway protein FliH